jgi:hypothetical protein
MYGSFNFFSWITNPRRLGSRCHVTYSYWLSRLSLHIHESSRLGREGNGKGMHGSSIPIALAERGTEYGEFYKELENQNRFHYWLPVR